MRNRKPKGPKLSVVFDEEKRKEYLTGFHKRKVERKKKAKILTEAHLAEEIKAVKLKYREAARQRLAGLKLPVFPDTSAGSVTSHKEDVIGNHTVTIEEIDISNSGYFFGTNKSDCITADINPDSLFKCPKMSLKAALKMNPKKSKKRHKSRGKSKTRGHKRRP